MERKQRHKRRENKQLEINPTALAKLKFNYSALNRLPIDRITILMDLIDIIDSVCECVNVCVLLS